VQEGIAEGSHMDTTKVLQHTAQSTQHMVSTATVQSASPDLVTLVVCTCWWLTCP
jgi:hypothetical protein